MPVMQIKYRTNPYIINNNSQNVQKNFGQKQCASSCPNRVKSPDDTLKTYYGIQQACHFVRIVNRLTNLKSPDIPSSALNYFNLGIDIEGNSEELNQEMRFNVIAAYEQSGDWESAKVKLTEYLEDYPDDEAAQKEMEFLNTR